MSHAQEISVSAQDWPLLLGHRGASFEAPENTLQAFERAIEVGADGVELDVHATADEVLIVDHDGIIDGVAVQHLTRAAVREARPNIPDLTDALDVLGSRVCNIEIKNWPMVESPIHDPNQRAAGLLAELFEHRDSSTAIVSSFDVGAVDRFQSLAPQVEAAWLTSGIEFAEALAFATDLCVPWLNCNGAQLLVDAQEKIGSAHDVGIRIAVWTVDDQEQWKQLVDGRVDAIITNDPRRFREWQEQQS